MTDRNRGGIAPLRTDALRAAALAQLAFYLKAARAQVWEAEISGALTRAQARQLAEDIMPALRRLHDLLGWEQPQEQDQDPAAGDEVMHVIVTDDPGDAEADDPADPDDPAVTEGLHRAYRASTSFSAAVQEVINDWPYRQARTRPGAGSNGEGP